MGVLKVILTSWTILNLVGLLVNGFVVLAFAVCIVTFLAICTFLITQQENLLYVPYQMGSAKAPADNPKGLRNPRERGLIFEELRPKTLDGVTLHAWFMTHSESAPTILFCHANHGNMGLRLENFEDIVKKLGANVLAFDYRGYGESEGSPTEEGLIEDALCCWRWIKESVKAGQIRPDRIFVFGRSLGAAVNIALCSELQRQTETEVLPAGIILENTFTSISDLVDDMFPWFSPFHWLISKLKTRFLRLEWNSIKRISTLQVPILLLSGSKDTTVPPKHMAQLHSAAKSSKRVELVRFEEGAHNDTWQCSGYWDAWKQFLKPSDT